MNKILISIFLMFIISCGIKPEIVSMINIEDAPAFYIIADSTAMVLVNTLGGRLTEVIQSDGIIKAIDVCKEEAYDITDDLEEKLGKNVSIKRVSNKYRNPKNAPDKYEIEALAWFEEQIAQGNMLPKVYGQKIQRNKNEIYRFYKPMKMQTKCLLCHGDEEALMPSVAERVKKLYPNDRATGYQEGDFRGVIRVEIIGETL